MVSGQLQGNMGEARGKTYGSWVVVDLAECSYFELGIMVLHGNGWCQPIRECVFWVELES